MVFNERSFSKLKIIENNVRTTMVLSSKHILDHLMILNSAKHIMVEYLNFKSVITNVKLKFKKEFLVILFIYIILVILF